MIKVSVVTIQDKTALIGPVTHEALKTALRKAAFDTQSDAQLPGHVPVDTGNLKNSIHANLENLNNLESSVDVGAEYGIYVEMGTHKMPARPYLIPAGDKAGAGFAKTVAALIKAKLG